MHVARVVPSARAALTRGPARGVIDALHFEH